MKLRPMTAMVLAASAASLVATAAFAQPNDPNWVAREKFRSLDKDANNLLTKDELSHVRGYAQAFDKADQNRDAKLNVDEFLEAEAIHDRMRAASYAGDAAITVKVKTALLREKDLKSMSVSVETDSGRVLLSGFVDNDAQRKKVVQVTSKVEGVKDVKDALIVK